MIPKVSINSNIFILKNDRPYHAFILLGKQLLQICITDEEEKRIDTLQDYFKEDGLLTKNELIEVLSCKLIMNAQKVVIGVDSAKNTLLPNALYDSEQKAHYLERLYQLDRNEIYAEQKIQSLNITDVYSIKLGTYQLLQSQVPNTSFKHSKASLLDAYLDFLSGNKRFTGFLYQTPNETWISIFDKKNLILHNSFECQSHLDALYYFSNVCEQFGMEKHNINLQVGGEQEVFDDLIQLFQLHKFDVRPIGRIKSLEYDPQIQQLASHRFFNLFALIDAHH